MGGLLRSMSSPCLEAVHRALLLPVTKQTLTEALTRFLSTNSIAARSPNLAARSADETMQHVIVALSAPDSFTSDEMLLLLRTFKILLRKPANRMTAGPQAAAAITTLLQRVSTSSACLCECANVLLNACFEAVNVSYICSSGGMQALLRLLQPNSR
jgi:hypothetical protein